MWIPRATYQSVQRGIVLREIHCEHCGAEFAYALSRESVGEGTSLLFLDNSGAEERAVEDAAKNLEAMLAKEVDPVPCPKCHLYQASMVQHLRDGSYWWMNAFALLGLLASIISGAVLLSMTQYDTVGVSTKLGCGITVIAAGLGALGVWILRGRLSQAYDPNNDYCLAMRQSCKQPTMLKEDVEKVGADSLLAPIEKAHARSDLSDVRFHFWLRMATCLMVAGIGIYFLVGMRGELISGYASSGWPRAKARVIAAFVNSKTEKQKDKMVTYYFPEIAYTYEVQGKEFKGSRYRFEPVINRDQHEMQAIVRPLQPSTEFEIHYNILNPSDSVILPGISAARRGIVVFLVCVVVGGLGFLGFEVRRYLRLQNAAVAEIE